MKKFKIFFEITNKCNHNCVHCCKYWEECNTQTMSYSLLSKLLDFPASFYKISGGEPSLVKDKVRFFIENTSIPISINTNLTNWTYSDLDFLDSKNVSLAVSVVSVIEDVYTSITKANTYNKFMDNLDYISRNSTITIVISPLNLSSTFKTCELLINKGFNNFVISPMLPTSSLSVSLDKSKEVILSLIDKYPEVNIQSMYYLSNNIPCSHLCEAGVERLVISPDGRIYPCGCFPAPVIGNLNNYNIDNLIKNGRNFYNSFSFEYRKLCKGTFLNGQ